MVYSDVISNATFETVIYPESTPIALWRDAAMGDGVLSAGLDKMRRVSIQRFVVLVSTHTR